MSTLELKRTPNLRQLLLWSARIWASLVIAFVMYFLLAHVYGAIFEGQSPPAGSLGIQDMFLFLCFPLGTVIGLALAYKWEFTGGMIAGISLLAMFAIQITLGILYQDKSLADLPEFLKGVSIFLVFIMPPAILYVIYGIIKRNSTHTQLG